VSEREVPARAIEGVVMRLLVVISLILTVVIGTRTASGRPATAAVVDRHGAVASARTRPPFMRSPSFLQRAGQTDSTIRSGPRVVSNHKVVYQGGPILTATHVHLIVWYGPASASATTDTFLQTMQRYVKQANGKSLFRMLHQYFMINPDTTKTYPSASVTLADTFVDRSPIPSSCTHPITGTYCITDADIQSEITKVITQQSWTYGIANNDVFIVLTMTSGTHDVGACFTGTCGAGDVSGQDWCGYHDQYDLNLDGTTEPAIYSYVLAPLTDAGYSCIGVPSSPHFDDEIDSYLTVISHEHVEMITDPLPRSATAWRDLSETDTTGGEVADKCAWYFSPLFPSPLGAGFPSYNQQWGPLLPAYPGSLYVLQDEWSNKAFKATGSGCVQRAS
jgi:hypothetical protein